MKFMISCGTMVTLNEREIADNKIIINYDNKKKINKNDQILAMKKF